MSKLRTLNRQAWGRVPGGAAGGGGEGLGYILAATRAGSVLSCPPLNNSDVLVARASGIM